MSGDLKLLYSCNVGIQQLANWIEYSHVPAPNYSVIPNYAVISKIVFVCVWFL